MEEKKESIGTRFRIVRKSKGMNQCDFANLLGISQAYLSSIETGGASRNWKSYSPYPTWDSP